MSVTALVMAGGKGSRMTLAEEKPLIIVDGKPVIEHVIEALADAKRVKSIIVAVSKHTPKTALHATNLPVKVIQTPGKEYVSDMGYAVKKLKLDKVLAIAADLPLITAEIIDSIVNFYDKSGKPALTVAVPMAKKAKFGLGSEYALKVEGEPVVPAGINIIDGRRINEEELEDAICIIDMIEVAVNINTVKELKIAERILHERLGNN